jgi:DNA primase
MKRISEQTIELVRSSADLVEVVGSYIELKKKGRNFLGLCPFHGEKTPSFSVSPDKQIYKCFGCGEGGGVINFLMAIDTLSFIESVEKLAEMYNIKIETSASDKRIKNLKDQLLDINKLSANYYSEQLNKNETIKEYLYQRNFNDDMIKLFQLGYSDKSSSKLLSFLQDQKFSSEALKKSGLFSDSQRGYFDRFFSRLIFPITDKSGNVIAFAGRDLTNKQNIAKYINSIETPIYNKSKTFYGLNLSKDFIRKENSIILVEGYFDLIRLYQHNIKNVVAISGTSFTDLHASIIKQYSKNIIIAFDGDSAGKKAAIRTGYTLLKNDINPKILSIPDGMDPDDWVDTDGPNPFIESIKKSKTVINFNCDFLKLEEKNDISLIVEHILNEISLIENPIFREISAKDLADAVNLSEENIIMSLNNKLSNKRKFNNKSDNDVQRNVIDNNANILLEDDFIRLCLNDNVELRKIIFKHMNKDWLNSQIHINIYDYLYIHLKSEDKMPINLIINKITDNSIRSKLTDLSMSSNKIDADDNLVFNCLTQLEKEELQKELNLLKNKLKKLNDDSLLTDLLTKISTLEKTIADLDPFLKYK